MHPQRDRFLHRFQFCALQPVPSLFPVLLLARLVAVVRFAAAAAQLERPRGGAVGARLPVLHRGRFIAERHITVFLDNLCEQQKKGENKRSRMPASIGPAHGYSAAPRGGGPVPGLGTHWPGEHGCRFQAGSSPAQCLGRARVPRTFPKCPHTHAHLSLVLSVPAIYVSLFMVVASVPSVSIRSYSFRYYYEP